MKSNSIVNELALNVIIVASIRRRSEFVWNFYMLLKEMNGWRWGSVGNGVTGLTVKTCVNPKGVGGIIVETRLTSNIGQFSYIGVL